MSVTVLGATTRKKSPTVPVRVFPLRSIVTAFAIFSPASQTRSDSSLIVAPSRAASSAAWSVSCCELFPSFAVSVTGVAAIAAIAVKSATANIAFFIFWFLCVFVAKILSEL